MDDKRSTLLAVSAAYLLGLAAFIGVRGAVAAAAGIGWPSVLWFALPLAATYTGAAAMGVTLVRDGMTLWWWLPALLFVALGLPVDGWVIGSSLLATRLAPVAGSAADLALVLAPAAVLFIRARGPRVDVHGRLIPALAVFAVSVLLAMRVGQESADVSMSVGAALLAFGICSRATSWRRALLFVTIAVAVGAQVPGSFATAISQGNLGPLAIKDVSMEVVVACLCFAIAPLARAWDSVLTRREDRRALAEV